MKWLSCLLVALASVAACKATEGDASLMDAALFDGAVNLDGGAPHDAASGSGSDAGQCPEVATPETVFDPVIAGQSPGGVTELTAVDGFSDDYLYSANSQFKIGTRRQWGGSVIFYGIAEGSGPGNNASNTIDANDTGREVQVAIYDASRLVQDCAWNASCGQTASNCPASITFLGWNPVQGGNRCNNGSGVESVSAFDGVLQQSTIPLQWNPNWDRNDCSDVACDVPEQNTRRSDVRIRQTMRFVQTHTVQVEYAVENLANIAHPPTVQELPTLYAGTGNNSAFLSHVLDSFESEVTIDQPANDGFFVKNFSSPNGWVAIQNDDSSYGVGIYYENRLADFQAWQNLSMPFTNVRARFVFGLPALGVVRARAYLMLGSFDTIAAQVATLDAAIGPFGVLDAPAADSVLSGVVELRGWALDNHAVNSVSLWIDGLESAELSYGASRPDVCSVWPGYAACNNVGFSGSFDTANLSPCAHILEIRASDAHGNTRILARRRVSVSQ